MIDFIHVSKHFAAQDILNDASLRINAGERVGVVGPNGAGKTTIFRLITGELSPDRGEVAVQKNIRMGYLRQELKAHEQAGVTLVEYTEDAIPELAHTHAEIHRLEREMAASPGSARECLERIGRLQTAFENGGGYEMSARAEKTLCSLGFRARDLARPFAEFSGGWQMRAELARVLIAGPDLLLLDEPSNYLDLPAVEWLRGFIQSFPGTLLLISHDRYLLDTLTQVTVECAGHQLTRYPGNYAYYQSERVSRHQHLLAAKQNLDRRRAQIERFVERFRAKNTKATQVQSRIKQLEKMEDIELPHALFSGRRIDLPEPPHSGAETVALRDAGLSYDGENWIFRHLDLQIQRGEKIALVGFNGIGKTTLLRVIAQALPPSEGQVRLGHQVVIGYQSQEFSETMPPESSLFQVVRSCNAEASDSDVRAILGAFGFSGDHVHKQVRTISGGEKIRLAFARIFIQPPNFLVLDEPTTHLDIATREALERALGDYEGTVCLVSHDTVFVRNTATGIIEMSAAGVRRFHGGYDYYLQKRGSATDPAAAGAARERDLHILRRRGRQEEEKQRKQRVMALRKTVRDTEALIERLEREQAELIGKLSAPGAAPDYAAINQRLTAIARELPAHHLAWETHATELDREESGGA